MDFDFADLKPTLWNTLIVGTMAVLYITFFKFLFAKWEVPYMSELFGSL